MTDATDSTPALVLPTADTPVTVAAEMYAELGFAVVPLYGVRGAGTPEVACTCDEGCEARSYGKHPIGAHWQKRASADVDQVRSLFRNHRGNIGIVLGGLVVIDVDGPAGFESLASLGPMPLTLTSRSGSGIGEHRVYRYARHQDASQVTNRRLLPGLDIKTRTGQIAVAPSLHRLGHHYEWTVPMLPATLPDELYERLVRRAEVAPVATVHELRPSPGTLLRRAEAYLARIPPAISGSGGHAQAFAAARALVAWTRKGLPTSDALALLQRYNAGCQPPWSKRELEHKWSEAQRATDIPDIEDRPAPAAPGAQPAGTRGTPPSFRSRLIYETAKNGQPRLAKHPENAIVIVRYHPQWEGRIRLDTHSSTVTVTDPPWHESDRPTDSTGTRPWTDADSIRLSSWIRREEHTDLSIEACDRAVMVAAEANAYHPVRDWMRALQWDGILRLHAMGARYFGSPVIPHYEPFRWWMTAAVARTFDPGCKVDNVLILEGAQGLRKSSALSVLASPAWFSDTPLDLQSKDSLVALQGKLIVELAELETLRKADAARAKAFFSSRVDDYRPPFGRRNVKAPRQCVFAGTVNHASYLQDTTGNRRYWPVACSAINLEALTADREQLWAEAVAGYLAGQAWWPAGHEAVAACTAAQEPRAEGDEWETLIATWLRLHPSDTPTVGELLRDVLDIPRDRWTRGDQMRVSGILQRLGLVRRQVRSGTDREWRYSRTAPVSDSQSVGVSNG